MGDQIVSRPGSAHFDVGPQEADEGFSCCDCTVSSIARVRPAMYMPTIAFDHSSRSGAISSGTPRRRAMMRTGRGCAKCFRRSKGHPAQRLGEFLCQEAMSGASSAMRREVKARRTRFLRRVTWRLQLQHGMGLDRIERRKVGRNHRR